MLRVGLLAGIILLLATIGLTREAVAFWQPGKPVPSLPAPDDWVCVEANEGWAYYYYRLPVIFQETGPDGKPVVVAFGYADGCKQSGKGVRGATFANLQVLTDPVWAPDVEARLQAVARDLVPLQEALPGSPSPADNALRSPLPDLTMHYADLYDQQSYRSLCKYLEDEPETETICPGIAPPFAKLLEAAGFLKATDSKGYTRYLLDSTVLANRIGWWWTSTVPNPGRYGNFYGRNWALDLLNNHSNGGVMRLILNPTDLGLTCQGASVKAGADAVGSVRVSINQPKSIATRVGWRLAGAADWQLGTAVAAAQLANATTVDLTFPLPGVNAGQTVEFMVNYDRKIAEMGADPNASAYTNNTCTAAVAESRPNLEIYDIWYSPGKPNPGEQVLVTVAVKNSSDVAYGPLVVNSLRWSAGGETFNAAQNWTLQPGEEHRFALGTFATKAPGTVTVVAEVNPDHNQPANERDWADNRTVIDIAVAGSSNLKLTVDAPPTTPFAPDSSYTITFHITNEGATAVTVPLTARVTTSRGQAWSLGTRSVTIGPGETVTQTRNVNIMSCADNVTVTGMLNPEPRTVAEPSYDDNTASAVTRTGDCDAPVLGDFSGGGGDTIIVPEDCITNPDITSVHPCTNYPNLTITR
jgi:hypothetical protein